MTKEEMMKQIPKGENRKNRKVQYERTFQSL